MQLHLGPGAARSSQKLNKKDPEQGLQRVHIHSDSLVWDVGPLNYMSLFGRNLLTLKKFTKVAQGTSKHARVQNSPAALG